MGAFVVLILNWLLAACKGVAAAVVNVVRSMHQGRKPLELKLSVVGFEACGKTVFLGCMYNELRVPDRDGVFLDTPPEMRAGCSPCTAPRPTRTPNSRIRPASR